jgi:hypothetical protein
MLYDIKKGTEVTELPDRVPDYTKFGKVKRKPFQEWNWRDINGIKIPLYKMKRPHVQNCLNWCIKKSTNPAKDFKDGHTYQEWITAFTVLLFDPECK